MEIDLIEQESRARNETIATPELTGSELGFLKRFRLASPDELENLSPQAARERIQVFMNEPVGEERMRTLTHYGLADPLEGPVTGAEYLARRTLYDSLKIGPRTRKRLENANVNEQKMRTLTIGEARKMLRALERVAQVGELQTREREQESSPTPSL